MKDPPPKAAGAASTVGPLAFLGAAILVTTLNLIPHGETVLYPLAIFTTWVHETAHALAATVLGARVDGLLVRPDTSGLATYWYVVGDFGTTSRAITASAGYLGAALAAAAFLAAARRPGLHRIVLGVVAAGLVVTTALWVRTGFGVTMLLVLAATAGGIAAKGPPPVVRWALLLLALQTGLNAVLDIRALYYVDGPSDARTMSQVVGLPAAFWATLWLAIGAAVLARGFLKALRG
ncbi:MAG: M50 family metallopeptidase [Deltaproteobacteria bacterium]|nr:M50 family metallopeptidase [Deltaproteobacteria bacterium]